MSQTNSDTDESQLRRAVKSLLAEKPYLPPRLRQPLVEAIKASHDRREEEKQ